MLHKTTYNLSSNLISSIQIDKQKSIKDLLLAGANCMSEGKIDEIFDIANTLIKKSPQLHYGWLYSLFYHFNKKNYSKALIIGGRALEINKKCEHTLCLMGDLLLKIGKTKTAEECYKKAIKSNKKQVRAYLGLTQLYQSVGDFNRAETFIKKALIIEPNNSDALNSAGLVLTNLGKNDEASKYLWAAVNNKPASLSALWNLIRLKKITENDEELINKVVQFYKNPSIGSDKKKSLAFSLAKIYKDLNVLDMAFECWNVGNLIAKNNSKQRISDYAKYFASRTKNQPRIKYDYENFDENDWFIKNKITPIFILGMPRSGTSLMEQILGSHSEITPLGEITALPEIIQLLEFDPSMSRKIGAYSKHIRQNYADYLKYYSIPSKFFTDKLPTNFLNLGWIINAFPEAKIIHTNRDPMAICFSIFTQNFSAEGLGWTYDLEDIGNYYNLYKNWMGLMKANNPSLYLDLIYEDLVESPEQVIRQTLNYIGLEFEENCLEFHNQKRRINTASFEQVNKPLYKGSSYEWKKYEPFLKPLIDIIDH